MIKVGAMSYSKLIKELRNGPATFRELAETTGLHYTTVREYVGALHKDRNVHIAGYHEDRLGRPNTPMWMLGSKADVKRFKMTPAERSERYRMRNRAMRLNQMFAGSAP